MMESEGRSRLGVCTWSLRPDSPTDLVRKVRLTALEGVQLALEPLRCGAWSVEETSDVLGGAGIDIRSGMMEMTGEDYSSIGAIRATGGVRPDDNWAVNRAAAEENAALARRLGLSLVTFHAGFLPDDPADVERETMIERLQVVIDVFADQGVTVGLETGQETAATLQGVLEQLDRPTAGVNFDPANMLLYGTGDPVEALASLASRVCQIHVKDATPSPARDVWGKEVVVGTGAVDWKRFFTVVAEAGLASDAMIEREAGDDRIGDIVAARQHVGPLIEAGS